ncbi:MAG: transposase [Dehalococcoidia bacterium]
MPQNEDALAYFLTFTCHGTWLHGDERGSVQRLGPENVLELDANRARHESARRRMTGDPVTLDLEQRRVVDSAIRETCKFHGWEVKALNVRTNHVHLVVASDVVPERVMNTVKVWATTMLKRGGLLPPGGDVWTRRGSKRYLWREDHVSEVCWYVLNRQGPDLI